jgi:hypothetical protein
MKERDVTRERFLAAIAEKVDVSSIAEAHLFQPIKQGGMESGVAVVAVSEGQSAGEPVAVSESQSSGAEEPVAPGEEQLLAAGEAGADAGSAAPGAAENREVGERATALLREPNVSSESERLAVYTAKYRLTLKGPDRGKWDFAIQAEADAPLVTVDRVVRGVQRRSGDTEEPQRLTGEEFRSQLQGTGNSE